MLNSTTKMTKTPETDANDDAWAYNMKYNTFSSLMDTPLEWDEFSRKLERERDDLIASRDRLAETNYSLAVMLEDERNERNELTEAIQLKLNRIIELTTHNDIYWAIKEIGRLSLNNNHAEEPEQPVETEYRFLEINEIIEEGDEYNVWDSGWIVTNHNKHSPCKVEVANFYRRKVERKQECTCGRIKINHHTLGWICEDCEWHSKPY